jgi:RNA polymerase sigma-70 factor (ECF subfamily)
MRTSLGKPSDRRTVTPPRVVATVPGAPAEFAAESELDGPMERPEKPDADPVEEDLRTADGFSRWVQPHWHAMARLAARYSRDADDILQDALAVAWRKRSQFDPTRGSARTWLLTITADQRSKAWRRTVRTLSRPWADPQSGRPATDSAPDVPFGVPSPELRLDLRRAIGRLPAKQALAIDLHYYLGLGIAEVAAVMRCPEGTVKSHLSRARDRLRTQLGDDYR